MSETGARKGGDAMMMPYPYTLNPKKRSEFLPPVIVGSQRRNELAAFPVEGRSKDQNKRRRA